VALENGENIKVIGQLPSHSISADLGGEVRRVDQKEDVGIVLKFVEEGLIVLVHDGQAVKVAVCTIVASPNRVIEALLGEFGHIIGVFHREKERRR